MRNQNGVWIFQTALIRKSTPTGSMTRNLQSGGSSRVAGLEPGTSDYQDNRPIVGHDIFVKESLSIASKDIDEESEWSLDIPNSPN